MLADQNSGPASPALAYHPIEGYLAVSGFAAGSRDSVHHEDLVASADPAEERIVDPEVPVRVDQAETLGQDRTSLVVEVRRKEAYRNLARRLARQGTHVDRLGARNETAAVEDIRRMESTREVEVVRGIVDSVAADAVVEVAAAVAVAVVVEGE